MSTQKATCYKLVFLAGFAAGILFSLWYRAAQITLQQKNNPCNITTKMED